jgi:hypothetical protein
MIEYSESYKEYALKEFWRAEPTDREKELFIKAVKYKDIKFEGLNIEDNKNGDLSKLSIYYKDKHVYTIQYGNPKLIILYVPGRWEKLILDYNPEAF